MRADEAIGRHVAYSFIERSGAHEVGEHERNVAHVEGQLLVEGLHMEQLAEALRAQEPLPREE